MRTPLNHAVYDIRHASHGGSIFVDTDLSRSSFTNIDLSGARFIDVNLAGCLISNADLRDANITDAAIDGLRINGILVTELLQCYEQQQPEGLPGA